MLGNQKVYSNLWKKIVLVMRRTSNLMGKLTNKSVGFEAQRTVKRFMRSRCIHSLVWILGWRTDWSYFFEDEDRNAVTMNDKCYCNMITEFLWPQLDGMDLVDLWFQQDGATSHTAHETTGLLRKKISSTDFMFTANYLIGRHICIVFFF